MLFPPLDPLGLAVEVEVDGALWGPVGTEPRAVLVFESFVVCLQVAIPRAGGD